MDNLNLLFNKTYYENLGIKSGDDLEKDFLEKNDKLFKTTFNPITDYKASELTDENGSFRLMTTYPGLIIGSSNPHGAKTVDSDINIGFSLDYVTGQPFIPGSSVKGTLRSYFKTLEKRNAIRQILGRIKCCEYRDEEIKLIEEEIFDGEDVFFDAVIARGGFHNEIIGPDFITPHSSPVNNPVPILIMKVIPDVVFEFRFDLKNQGILDKRTKLELFKTVLMLFGIGSKTNVGYGRLIEEQEVPEEFRGNRLFSRGM